MGTALPRVSPTQVQWAAQRWPGITEQELNDYRELYIGRCSSCHNLVPPSEHTLEEWKVLLDKMAARAKITYGQKDDIWTFLVVMKQAPQQ